MRKHAWMALTLGALLMAGVALAQDEAHEGRLVGRSVSMNGCADMMAGAGMMGGGMMGGTQPNERWRSSASR